MTRGGRRKDREDGPERRCIVRGESGSIFGLIRFVVGPEGEVVPDLAERLPGRGMWLSSDRDSVRAAIKKRAFARVARAQVAVPDDLEGLLESLLARRAVDSLGLARKAGLAVTGFEKVKARLKQGPVAVLLHARDGSDQGLGKLRPMARGAPVANVLSSEELGLAFGRDYVIHAALDAGGAADRFLRDTARLAGFRPDVHRDLGPEIGDGPVAAGEDDDDRGGADLHEGSATGDGDAPDSPLGGMSDEAPAADRDRDADDRPAEGRRHHDPEAGPA